MWLYYFRRSLSQRLFGCSSLGIVTFIAIAAFKVKKPFELL